MAFQPDFWMMDALPKDLAVKVLSNKSGLDWKEYEPGQTNAVAETSRLVR
jgi:hypothetical protein